MDLYNYDLSTKPVSLRKHGISNGLYYQWKSKYSWVSVRFPQRKVAEYERLKVEIEALQRELRGKESCVCKDPVERLVIGTNTIINFLYCRESF